MGLGLRQFRYGRDNLGYLLFGRKQAMAVDGGAVEEILAVTARRGLKLETAVYTHVHPDHTVGRQRLLARSGARCPDNQTLRDGAQLSLEGHPVTVLHTPGHTSDSVCFAHGDFVLTGDTLFNGTVGNCFSGDLDAFYRSLRRLTRLSGHTRVFAGHDYVAESMAAARAIEPDNPHIDGYLAGYDPQRVYSTLADELLVNPYLRFDAPEMIQILQARGLPTQTSRQRFASIMQLG